MHIVQSPGGVARYLSMYLKYSDKNRFEHILICSLDYKMGKDGIFSRAYRILIYGETNIYNK